MSDWPILCDVKDCGQRAVVRLGECGDLFLCAYHGNPDAGTITRISAHNAESQP